MALPTVDHVSSMCLRAKDLLSGHRRVVTRKATQRPGNPKRSKRPNEMATDGSVVKRSSIRGQRSPSKVTPAAWPTRSRLLRAADVPRSLLSRENGRMTLVSHSARQSVNTLASLCARKPEGRDTKEDHSRRPRLRDVHGTAPHSQNEDLATSGCTRRDHDSSTGSLDVPFLRKLSRIWKFAAVS